MSGGVDCTKEWFRLAVPEPTDKSRSVQTAVHFEEVAEMLDSMGVFPLQAGVMHELSSSLKENPLKDEDFESIDRQELLDSLCDQIVTAIGVGHMFGFDIVGALDEVNRSNFSKFVDGKPVFNEQGKIIKGPDYFKPDLAKYLNRTV